LINDKELKMQYKQTLLSFITFMIAIFAGTKPVKAATFSVLADGLDNAKGISFAPDGSLYVTEAGIGGNGACVPSPSAQGNNLCYGSSGAITQIKNNTSKRILTGLPSLALPDGTQAAGAHDIKFDVTGKPYILLGYAANPNLRNALGSNDLGKIITPDFNTNSWKSIADLASYELTNNPDKGDVVSNPLDFVLDGNNFVAVDAGGNSVLSVGIDGSNLRELATIPNQVITNPIFPNSNAIAFDSARVPTSDAVVPPSEFSVQPVPSAIAKGLDGAYYVSEFTGFPFPEKAAKIYRIAENGKPEIYADGFTQLSDLSFDTEGNLYALQYANESGWKGNFDGSLIKIAPNGNRTTLASGGGLIAPTSLTIGSDGDIYIVNKGGLPGQGQVIKFDNRKSVPESTSTLGLIIISISSITLLTKNKNKDPSLANSE
jgi:hypothetical protein